MPWIICYPVSHGAGRGRRAEGVLNRLYLIVGGAIVVVLFAALVVPWFVNWDSYRANFEREATRILGHPVHVGGAAHVSILPSPSVTFTDVEVGDPGSPPMMTIETFSATVDLVPLLQGEFRVTSMKLDTPTVRVSVDEDGGIDWLKRLGRTQKLDPDRVVLGNVEIRDGSITYTDAATGVTLAVGGIAAKVEAASLAGPWRVDGTYLDGPRNIPFAFATGRQLEDGTIRLQSTFRPPSLPVNVSADGVLANTPAGGVTYTGTYSVAEAANAPPAGGSAPVAGWRSEGTFALSRDRVAVDKAILSNGPADRPMSVAGSLSVNFGKEPSFAASAEARQLDLDRAFGGGPDQPVNVADAAATFVSWVAGLPVPSIPGRIALSVPGIVVGGSVVQELGFAASPAPGGWRIDDLHAQLPGQASIAASGTLTTTRQVSFAGDAHLAVAQPSTFATWWRGGAQSGSGRLLAAFDIAGNTTIAPGRVSVQRVVARIGDAAITGRFDWGEVKGKRRELSTDLKANRIDFAQLKALADLLVGRDLTDASGLADSFSIRLAADAFQYDDVNMRDVAIDAGYAGDVLNVVQFAIGDLGGGASLRVAGGRIDDLRTNPRGHLDVHIEANGFDGLTALAKKFLPDTGLAGWLSHTAQALTPAIFTASVNAPPKGGDTGFQVVIHDGVAGSTTVNASFQSTANLKTIADWRSASTTVSASLDSPDSAALARQFGFAATPTDGDSGAQVSVSAAGVPKDGMDATVAADLAGVRATAKGKLTLAQDAAPAFDGDFGLTSDDLAPFVATAGVAIPGAAGGTPIAASGTLTTNGNSGTLTWQNGTVADRSVGGKVAVARSVETGWRVDGDLAIDDVDLGWLASLSLGFAPEPGDDAKAPWSKTPFSPPTYGAMSGKLAVTTGHLFVGDLDVTGGKLTLALQPTRIDADLKDGQIAGGAASGGFSIQNVEGSANLTGQFALTGAALDAFVWRPDDRPVATGALDLSANFESTGKSPAALVSSMTGGGVIAIRTGVAHNVNPETASAIVRVSDLGEPFSDEALRTAVGAEIDARPFSFGETGGAFSIAGGTVRLDGLTARGEGVVAEGGAVIDLNALAIDSDWTVTFATAGDEADAGAAKIGVGFRGPLAAPARVIDALPFNSYLSSRQASRMLDVIATEEADRAERQRLRLQVAKIKEDAARVERARQEAIAAAKRRAEAAARAIARVAAAHIDREIATDERLTTALVRAADNAAAVAASAEQAAAAAAANAADARAKADAAALALAASIAADSTAAAAVATTAADLATAQAKAATTSDDAATTGAVAEAAEQKAMAALAAEAKAKEVADKAAAAAAATAARLDAANATASVTRTAADAAASEAANAKTALTRADKALADTFKARDLAADVFSAATTAAESAQSAADETANRAVTAAQAAKEANTQRTRLALQVDAALNNLRSAQTARDNAKVALDKAKADYTAALGNVAQADLDNPGGETVSASAKRALADHAKQQLEIATKAYEAADASLASVSTDASAAQEQALAAVQTATAAARAAAEAGVASSAAQADLTEKAIARADAVKSAETTRLAAQQAGVNFNAAQAAVNTTADRAAATTKAADAAAKEQSAATAASAAASGGAPAFALQQASAARAVAVAEANTARAAADTAKAAAQAAAQTLAAATAAHDAAVAAAEVAHATRLANEKAAESTQAAVVQADADAASTAAEAKARAEDAVAAARRVEQLTEVDNVKPVVMPLPRQRQKPLSIVPDALAGDAPMSLTPAP